MNWAIGVILLVGLGYLLDREIYFYEGVHLGPRVQAWLYDRWSKKYDEGKRESQLHDPEMLARPLLDLLKDVPATSTAAQIKTAWDASAAVSLATCANAGGNDGTGVVAAFAATNLAGGAESVYVMEMKPQSIFRQTNDQVYIDISAANSLYLRCYKY